MLNRLQIEIRTDGAAFEDGDAEECARMLRDIAKRLSEGRRDGVLFDTNGNRCGSFKLERESD